MANGLDEARTLAHAEKIRKYSKTLKGFTVLAGAEVDILSDGRLDLADDCLAALDIVDRVAAFAAAARRGRNDHADDPRHRASVSRHRRPSHGPWLLRREGARFKIEKVIDAAVANGVALEINSQPHRLDLCDSHARLARDRGAKLAINSDAHEIDGPQLYALGYPDGAPGVADKDDVINTRPLKAFKAALRRNQ